MSIIFKQIDPIIATLPNYSITYIFPEELSLTAELCGLETEALYGDFRGGSYSYPERIEAVHILKHGTNLLQEV